MVAHVTSTTGRNSIRRLFHLRLGTVFLMVTTAGVFVAYQASYLNRIHWQSRLNRLETASGLPRVLDVSMHQVGGYFPISRTTPTSNAVRKLNWMVWVPFQRSARVRYARLRMDQPFPTEFEEVLLQAGRHRIELYFDEVQRKIELRIDERIVLDRIGTREWNISFPFVGSLAWNQPIGANPELIFHALGHLRLGHDESYDPSKHQFGLKIWVVR